MPERLSTFESPKCWHSRLTLMFFGGTNRTTHWIWDYPRRSLLHCCHFDPETLSVLEPEGEGEAGAFFTDSSGSRWLLKLCARAVSPRGTRRTGIDAVPLLEGTEGCLSMPQSPQSTSASSMIQWIGPKLAVLVWATPACPLGICESWASWELSFELH